MFLPTRSDSRICAARLDMFLRILSLTFVAAPLSATESRLVSTSRRRLAESYSTKSVCVSVE